MRSTSTYLTGVGVATLLVLSRPADAALIISINFTGYDANMQAVVNQAVTDLTSLLTVNGADRTIKISFLIDNNLGDLGLTSGWSWTGPGIAAQVTSSTVTIDGDAHNWTLGAPMAGIDDALDTVRHELLHAVGFTALGANFAGHVITVAGDRFFDTDHDSMLNAGDFDLIDDAGAGTHAPAGSGDLMQPSTPQGTRNDITMLHAQVLAHTYAWRVIPAPSALVVLLAGVVTVRRRRRRAAA